MEFKYKFTVFTPCYNSEKFIHRVIESLESQTYRDFEWLVVNDGSTDKTRQILSEYSLRAPFSMRLIDLEVNQMLTANINLAVREAQGKLMVFFGHDDKMKPYALERFSIIWDRYSTAEISAIYALAENQNGVLVGKKYKEDIMVSDYFSMTFSKNNVLEKFQCFSTEVLRKFTPLDLTIDKSLPNALLWGQIGLDYKAIFVNEILRTYYIEKNNHSALSKISWRKFPRGGQYYYLMWINKFQYRVKGQLTIRLRGILWYVTFGILLKQNILQIITPVNRRIDKIKVIILYPAGKLYNVFK